MRVALVGYGIWGTQPGAEFSPVDGNRSWPASWMCQPCGAGEGAKPDMRATAGALEDVLADDSLEAVVIATPACTHFALVQAACRPGT